MKRVCLFFLFMCGVVFAEEIDYGQLLKYRLENDPLFYSLQNEWQVVKNNYNSTRLSAYLGMALGSNGNFSASNSSSAYNFSGTSSVSINSPMLNNLGISSSFSYSDSEFKSANLGLSFDIYTQARKKLALQLQHAEDTLSIAENKLAMRASLIEAKLLSELQNMFSEYGNWLSSRLSVAQANLKYQQDLVQGYNENSSKLRAAKLSMMGAERDAKVVEYAFQTSVKIFCDDCGIAEVPKDLDAFFIKLSESVPEAKLIFMNDLTEENYLSLIKAENDYNEQLLLNKMDLNPVTVSGNADFSFSKATDVHGTKNTNTLSAGISFGFPGIKLSTGTSFIIENAPKPNFNFSVSVNPPEIYNYVLTKQNKKMSEENARFELLELKRKLKSEVRNVSSQKEKLEWQQKVCIEELEIYKKNAQDHAVWFEKGFISKLEKEQAELEYKKAILRVANSNIDIILFNTKMKQSFKISSENNTKEPLKTN